MATACGGEEKLVSEPSSESEVVWARGYRTTSTSSPDGL